VQPKHLCSELFSVWEQLKGEKLMIFNRGLASYLYMNLWNNKEGEGCSLNHQQQQDLWMVHSDFPSIPKSSAKFLWVERTHRNVFLATQRPRSQARDCGGQTGVPNTFQTSTSELGRYVETVKLHEASARWQALHK